MKRIFVHKKLRHHNLMRASYCEAFIPRKQFIEKFQIPPKFYSHHPSNCLQSNFSRFNFHDFPQLEFHCRCLTMSFSEFGLICFSASFRWWNSTSRSEKFEGFSLPLFKIFFRIIIMLASLIATRISSQVKFSESSASSSKSFSRQYFDAGSNCLMTFWRSWLDGTSMRILRSKRLRKAWSISLKEKIIKTAQSQHDDSPWHVGRSQHENFSVRLGLESIEQR